MSFSFRFWSSKVQECFEAKALYDYPMAVQSTTAKQAPGYDMSICLVVLSGGVRRAPSRFFRSCCSLELVIFWGCARVPSAGALSSGWGALGGRPALVFGACVTSKGVPSFRGKRQVRHALALSFHGRSLALHCGHGRTLSPPPLPLVCFLVVTCDGSGVAVTFPGKIDNSDETRKPRDDVGKVR